MFRNKQFSIKLIMIEMDSIYEATKKRVSYFKQANKVFVPLHLSFTTHGTIHLLNHILPHVYI